MRDEYGYQIRFERTDKSGRYNPIQEPITEPWWVAVVGGAAFRLVLVGMFWGAV